MLNWFKDTFVKYWFILTAALIPVVYWLLDKKGRTIEQLRSDLIMQKMSAKVTILKEKSLKSDQDFKEALDEYEKLKKQYPDIFDNIEFINAPGSTRNQ